MMQFQKSGGKKLNKIADPDSRELHEIWQM
jgi:hypothetical protein